ncbi:MAG TPA: glycosyltransferase family 87 protein, partial [Ardenticatenaceae bacterium]|nr:glycosyltransferase family 87 protein [Ardenticatenaceae bacterium]
MTHTHPLLRPGLWLLVGYLAISFGFYFQVSRVQPGAADFFTPWLGARARLVEGLNPYSEAVTIRSQRSILGREAGPDEDQLAFAYPLTAVILLAPFAVLAYPVAQAFWVSGLMLAACVLSRAWVRPRLGPLALAGLFLWTIFFYPLARGLILGQIAVAVALLFSLAAVLLLRPASPSTRQQIVAGVALAFTLVKPQLMFLAVPLLLWRAWRMRQRHAVIAFAATGLLLFVTSTLLQPGWLADWLHQLSRYAQYVDRVPLIRNAVPDPWLSLAATVALLLAVLLAGWRRLQAPSERFEATLWLSMVVTLLITPRSTVSDQSILALPMLALIDAHPRRGLLLAGALAVGLWLLFFATLSTRGESPLIRAPVPV